MESGTSGCSIHVSSAPTPAPLPLGWPVFHYSTVFPFCYWHQWDKHFFEKPKPQNDHSCARVNIQTWFIIWCCLHFYNKTTHQQTETLTNECATHKIKGSQPGPKKKSPGFFPHEGRFSTGTQPRALAQGPRCFLLEKAPGIKIAKQQAAPSGAWRRGREDWKETQLEKIGSKYHWARPLWVNHGDSQPCGHFWNSVGVLFVSGNDINYLLILRSKLGFLYHTRWSTHQKAVIHPF